MNSIALVGSPNSGKTTLFNALTGSRQKTANYAGVTVEKKEGILHIQPDLKIQVIDLPGTYSLESATSPDELITSEIIRGAHSTSSKDSHADVFLAVADATNLATNLYLVLELLEYKKQGTPVVLAVTMSDLAKKNGLEIRTEVLEKELGIPVILTSAVKGNGLDDLKENISSLIKTHEHTTQRQGDHTPKNSSTEKSARIIKRYQKIEKILKTALVQKKPATDLSRRIDDVVLHRVFGPLLLATILLVMFQLIFSLAEIPMQAIETAIAWLQTIVRNTVPAGLFQSLVTDGILAGVGAVVVFLPQILILYMFILLFEDSGYMARAAFILDRLMGFVGLHGKSFIPLLSSFACAIPGIMATRTIENRRDRLVTILIAPLMTCSARIPVYTMLIAAFIPNQRVLGILNLQGLVMAGLYAAGIFAALVVGFILRKLLLRGRGSTFLMELPTYKMPALKNVALGLLNRAKLFLTRAGTIILVVSIVLWAAASFPRVDIPSEITDEKTIAAFQIEHSVAGRVGKFVEPALKPLGFDWKVGIGILSSLAAREVVLSTLGTVYAVGYSEETGGLLAESLKRDSNFNLATALSLLVFYILACQCISTLAVTRRETNSWRWPVFMFSYMTLLAWVCAFATYRLAQAFLLS